MTEFGLEAVISPVSVADKAKSDDFDLRPDLDLACDLLSFFYICLKSTHRELSFAASPTSLRPRVLELSRAAKSSPPPPQRGAG